MIETEIVAPGVFAAREDAFAALTARALEPNVFAEPAAVEAAHAHAPIEVVLAWEGERLVGALPIACARHHRLLPVAVATPELHPFAVWTAPVLDREAAAPALDALIAAVGRAPSLPSLLRLGYAPDAEADRAVWATFGAERRLHVLRRYARARLDVPPDGRQVAADQIGHGDLRRRLARFERRLRGQGEVVYAWDAGAQAARSLETFLELEARGWKGRAGTAILSSSRDAAFVRRTVAGLAARGRAEVVTLRWNGRALASGLAIRSGRTAWFWKIAYDEAHARVSPGKLLAREATRGFLADPSLAKVDSCIWRGAGMLAGLWGDEQPIADLLIETRPSAATAAAVRLFERGYDLARDVKARLVRRS